MCASRSFVDTNVLVYAHDAGAGEKCSRARELVEALWESGDGCLSVQVLQEFFVTVTRKVGKPMDPDAAAAAVDDLSRWRVHSPAPEDVLAAIDIYRRLSLSFWDAMIVRSAGILGCSVLYTEDLNPGQRYEGVEARNPFTS